MPPTDFVDEATEAFRATLLAHYTAGRTPSGDPRRTGRRAAAAALSSEIWEEAAGPFVDTDGARAALGGASKQAVSQRVAARTLLGLRLAGNHGGRDRLVYPAWQFQSQVLRLLPDVLRAAGYDPARPTTGWTIASWLSTADPALDGQTPLAMLRGGHVGRVKAAAHDVAESLGVGERAIAR